MPFSPPPPHPNTASGCRRKWIGQHGLFSTMQLLRFLLTVLAAFIIPPAVSFLSSPLCLPSSLGARHQNGRNRASRAGTPPLLAQEDGINTAAPGSSDDLCPGYPRCSGEYRDKGCDGTGR